MQIREIDPNETRYTDVESVVSKIPVPKFTMPSFAKKQLQPQQPPVPPHPKVKVIVKSPQPEVAQMQPQVSSTLSATPTMRRPAAPLPIYRPAQPDYEYPNMEEVYGQARYDPVAIAATKPQQAPRQHFKLNLNFNMKKMPLLVAEGVAGFVAIYFGLTQTGSYYTPASRFAGDLATVFYGYQLGTLLAMVGVVLIYDAVRRAANL